MKSIEELQAELKQIYADLEERRIMEQESVPQTVDFDELSSKAERYKIENHPMSGKSEREQEMYLLLLLSVVSLDSSVYEKSFSLLYRISHGMGFKGNVQELFLKAQQMNFNTIDEITRMFINDDIRLVLLMECIMISQCFQKEKKKAMEYIAELCTLMKLEKKQIILISNIARAILTQDVNEYKCEIKNTYEVFDCYIIQYNPYENIQCYTFGDITDKKSGDWIDYKVIYLSTGSDCIIFKISGYHLVHRSSIWYTDKVRETANIEMPLNQNYLYYVCEEEMFVQDMARRTPYYKTVVVYGKSMLFYSFAKRKYPELFKEDQ